MRFLAFVFCAWMSVSVCAEETAPAQTLDVGALKIKPLPAPSNAKFNSVVSKTPPVVAKAGQALTADGAGKTVWANVLGTALDSNPASSGMVLTSDGNGGATWLSASSTFTGILPIANGGTGSSTQNFVDLATNQNIAGNKTFTGAITGNLTGNVSGSAASFTGSLAGDVTGTQSATVVSTVGGVTAANVASGANLANAATTNNTPNTVVKRDGNGNIPGIISAFADFYALMPGDNSAPVAVGSAVAFPQNGPMSNITRSSPTQFVLPAIGTYQVNFQVSVSEPGQLVVGLDSGAGPSELAYTAVGRATGTSQIFGTCLVSTTVVNSVLSIPETCGKFDCANHNATRWRHTQCVRTPRHFTGQIESSQSTGPPAIQPPATAAGLHPPLSSVPPSASDSAHFEYPPAGSQCTDRVRHRLR